MLYKCFVFAGKEDFLSNIVHLRNVGSMLGQRRRRWPNIKQRWVRVRWSSIQSYNQVTSSTTLYCILKAYTHASLEPDSIFKSTSHCTIIMFSINLISHLYIFRVIIAYIIMSRTFVDIICMSTFCSIDINHYII